VAKRAGAKLSLEFANPRGAARRLGPFDRILFQGETLVGEPGGVVAKHMEHKWHLTGGGEYMRLETNGPVAVHFSMGKQRLSSVLGPFKDFSSVDGIAYVERQVFAFCDREQGDWYAHQLGTHWKTMVVEPA
jgi:hypothetical protein